MAMICTCFVLTLHWYKGLHKVQGNGQPDPNADIYALHLVSWFSEVINTPQLSLMCLESRCRSAPLEFF